MQSDVEFGDLVCHTWQGAHGGGTSRKAGRELRSCPPAGVGFVVASPRLTALDVGVGQVDRNLRCTARGRAAHPSGRVKTAQGAAMPRSGCSPNGTSGAVVS